MKNILISLSLVVLLFSCGDKKGLVNQKPYSDTANMWVITVSPDSVKFIKDMAVVIKNGFGMYDSTRTPHWYFTEESNTFVPYIFYIDSVTKKQFPDSAKGRYPEMRYYRQDPSLIRTGDGTLNQQREALKYLEQFIKAPKKLPDSLNKPKN